MLGRLLEVALHFVKAIGIHSKSTSVCHHCQRIVQTSRLLRHYTIKPITKSLQEVNEELHGFHHTVEGFRKCADARCQLCCLLWHSMVYLSLLNRATRLRLWVQNRKSSVQIVYLELVGATGPISKTGFISDHECNLNFAHVGKENTDIYKSK